jgi:hypothetical protein
MLISESTLVVVVAAVPAGHTPTDEQVADTAADAKGAALN